MYNNNNNIDFDMIADVVNNTLDKFEAGEVVMPAEQELAETFLMKMNELVAKATAGTVNISIKSFEAIKSFLALSGEKLVNFVKTCSNATKTAWNAIVAFFAALKDGFVAGYASGTVAVIA